MKHRQYSGWRTVDKPDPPKPIEAPPPPTPPPIIEIEVAETRRPEPGRHFGALVGRLVLTFSALVLACTGLVGIGAWASFNSTQNVTASFATGTVTLALGTTGTSADRLDIGVTGLAPGDTLQRSVDVINSGSIDWATLSLTTTATSSSLLDTDATNGLQMVVDECSVAWTESGGPPYTYTCSGTTTPRITTRAVIGSSLSIGGAALTAGATGHYRVTLSLPSNSASTTQGLSSTIQYSFTGTQRAGTAK